MGASSSRFEVFTDGEWALIVVLPTSNQGRRGHPFGDQRQRRNAGDGIWHRCLMHLLTEADATGGIEPTASVDATIARAHQHATNSTFPKQDSGGSFESQESATG